MRADRLLSIVLLLQKHQQMKAKTLAKSLGVTERTIYRDIEALSLSGIPVYTKTGPDGGCFLDEHYRMRLNWFTETELQTLLYTGSTTVLSDLGIQSVADNAILKLLSMLPTRIQQQAEMMQQRLYLDPSSWYDGGDEHPMLPSLKEAVWKDMKISVDYETWEGDPRQLTLFPYSLVYKSGRWYLVAFDEEKQQMRTYRVSRIQDLQTSKISFERDSQFDISEYWTKSSDTFKQRVPEYPVTLRAKTSALIYFQHMLSGRYKILQRDDEWNLIRVKYTVFEEARTSVLGLGTEVEVIEPRELHEAVIQQAQAIVDKYQTS